MVSMGIFDVFPGEFDALQTVGERQHEMRVTDPDQQPIDDRQRKRKTERYRKARTWLVADIDGSAHRFHAAADDVHSHASAGNVGDLPGGGETRRQNERRIAGSESSASAAINPRSTARARTASTSRPRPSSLTRIRTWAPGMRRREVQRAAGRFSGGPADLRHLDAVVDAVADQVHQRIVQLVDHRLVQFRLGPLDGQFDLFVQLRCPDREPAGGNARTWCVAATCGCSLSFPQLGRQPVDFFGYRQDVGIVPAARRPRSAAPARSPARPPG